MPIKPNGNGMFELYTKQVMKDKFKVSSPNLGDSVMMLMRQPYIAEQISMARPKPIKVIGRR
jgi:phage terminase large subunit